MEIEIEKAFENNLKGLSVSIPLDRMTAITGVSGSGKSTLLKNVLAAEGAQRYSCQFSRTIRSSLNASRFVQVKNIKNLPRTLLIDAKNSIVNPMSTVATASGLHESLRTLFVSFGTVICPQCNAVIEQKRYLPQNLLVDLVCDERYDFALASLRKVGTVREECFFDTTKKRMEKRTRTTRYATVHFIWKNATDSEVRRFAKEFGADVLVDGLHPFNPLLFQTCDDCGVIVPKLSRSRMSFSTPFDKGGGMCRCCHGTGETSSPSGSSFILDKNKTVLGGGLRFVSDRGIQYTTIGSSDLKAIARNFKINIKEPLSLLSREQLDIILHGSRNPISINTGRGKKKKILFHGVIGELQDSFAKGKGSSSLSPFFSKGVCPECCGTRFDSEVDSIQLFGKHFSDYLHLTISELDNWITRQTPVVSKTIGDDLNRIGRKTATLRHMACGHLSLDRKSATLSGGELQRIRVCSLLNACVNGICYLLDEPSTGLHDQDIKSLGSLLRDICRNGNTVIMVEHNRKLIELCDWVVDIGPGGGANGGNLLFSDSIQNAPTYATDTAFVLKANSHTFQTNNRMTKDRGKSFSQWLRLDHLQENNLKDISIQIPCRAFTVICGVSGSGKTTLMRDILNARIHPSPRQFGFDDVVYLSQRTTSLPNTSTVATQLAVFQTISKLFSNSSQQSPSLFLPNSPKGKCCSCGGRRMVFSDSGDVIGVCPDCLGKGYSREVLQASASGVLFEDLLEIPLSSIGRALKQKDIIRLSEFCDLLGIGHLTLSRRSDTISRGEVQRLQLANALSQKANNILFLLDEPSKGLHRVDAAKLVSAIHLLIDAGNTVIAVEHNTAVIEGSDYVVELGGVGRDGGHLLFNDYTRRLLKASTPTANCIYDHGSIPKRKPTGAAIKHDIEYSREGHIYHFKSNTVHRLKQDFDTIRLLSSSTTADFLAAAIPGNSLFSHSPDMDEKILSSPVVHTIDFASSTKRADSLYGLFGLRQLITSVMLGYHPTSKQLLQFVFDDESPTGKCPFCLGRGSTALVSTTSFMDKSKLSKECISFLKHNSSFGEIEKWLKLSKGFSLSAPLSSLDSGGQQVLFWGREYSRTGASSGIHWLGLIRFFLQNHAYYPAPTGASIYSMRKMSICPICNGEMLSPNYASLKLADKYSYKDVMTHPFVWLSNRIEQDQSGRFQEIRSVLQLIQKSGLGALKPADSISELDAPTAGLSCLLAIAVRGFVQSGIALFNIDSLPSDRRKIVMGLARQIGQNNTMFIC